MFDNNYFDCTSIKLNSYLKAKTITNQPLFFNNLSTLLGAIALSLIFSQTVLAQSFGGYCISQANDSNLTEDKKIKSNLSGSSLKIEVNRNDRAYTIAIDRHNQRKLLLEQAEKPSIIAQMTLAQAGGQIKNIVLGQDDWLWIDRSAIDYIMKVDFARQPPSFESPIKLPELSAKPCHFLRRLFKKCQHGEYSYSTALNRVFVNGYPIRSWRKQKYLNLEFVAGKKQPVPELLQQAVLVADIPQWNGALFKKPSGEALFYDGTKVVDLSADFRRLKDGANFNDWNIRTTAGGRSFLGKFVGRMGNEPLFLMELKAQPGFKPVYLPEDFNQRWLDLFTFPDDPNSTLWIITRKGILAEVDRKIKTIVDLPSLSFIRRLKPERLNSVEQNRDVLAFTVKQEGVKSNTDYLLKTKSVDDNCETVVNLQQPIILKKSEQPEA